MASYVCRRLIVLLDGTWNDADAGGPATNIVYLRELLFWGLQRRFDKAKEEKTPQGKRDAADYDKLDQKKAASGMIFDGFEYVAYYGRGVGTSGLVDSIKGGALGFGLDKDIRRAYKFLSQWFRPGDEIYIFGFSRGAFTARSLSGYLTAVGLLRSEFCTKDNEQRAWDFYRTPPQDRVSADWLAFRMPLGAGATTALVHDAEQMRVRALCVFDTVGALGVPGNLFRQFNRSKYEFHDTEVNTGVDIRLHAVALDEPRPEFLATMWTKPKFKHFNNELSPTEQVWFPGAHGDIGGGYVQWDEVDAAGYPLVGLSNIPLSWMIKRLNHHLAKTQPLADTTTTDKPTIEPQRQAPIPFFGNDFFDSANGALVLRGRIREQAVKGRQHKPWELISAFRPDNLRVINQVPVSDAGRLETEGRIQHADPIGEMIHVSAFERLLKQVERERRGMTYRPTNLLAAIPFVAASYVTRETAADTPWPFIEPIFTWQRILVVDWDGTPLIRDKENPAPARRAFEIMPRPEILKIAAMPPEMRKYVVRHGKACGRATAGRIDRCRQAAAPAPPSAQPSMGGERGMKLFTYWRSQAAFRVRIAMRLKGLAMEKVSLDLLKGDQFAADYQKLNPEGVVPTLIDDDEAPPLVQSLAILEYLDEKYPDPPLLPRDLRARAHARALAQTVAMDAHPFIVPRVRKYLDEELHLDEPSRAKWVRHWLDAGSRAIEETLAHDPRTGKFCVGDSVTVADICLAAHLTSAKLFGGRDPNDYPVAGRIYANCMVIPAFADEHPLRQPDAQAQARI